MKRTNGLKARLLLAAKNLPEGISATEVEVPDKGGEVTIKFAAVETAAPASQPFQLVLRETESGREHPVPFSMTTTGDNNGVPQGYTELVIDSTDQLWLTVIAAPKAETPKAEKPDPQRPVVDAWSQNKSRQPLPNAFPAPRSFSHSFRHRRAFDGRAARALRRHSAHCAGSVHAWHRRPGV